MKLLALLLLLSFPQNPTDIITMTGSGTTRTITIKKDTLRDTVQPNVEHHKESHVETTDHKVLSCPAGYEGHYVVQQAMPVGGEFGPLNPAITYGNVWGTLGVPYYAVLRTQLKELVASVTT